MRSDRVGAAREPVASLVYEVILQQTLLLEALVKLRLAINEPAPSAPPAAQPVSRAEHLTQYPAGALLRVKDICGDRKSGRPGLLPIVSRTWLKWVEQGRVPQGILLGTHTRVWPVEQVLAVREGLPAGGAAPDEQHIRKR